MTMSVAMTVGEAEDHAHSNRLVVMMVRTMMTAMMVMMRITVMMMMVMGVTVRFGGWSCLRLPSGMCLSETLATRVDPKDEGR